MSNAAGTKAAEIKIERVIARMHRNHYTLSLSATQRKTDVDGWVIDWQVRDTKRDETIVITAISASKSIADIASELDDEIKTVRASHEAAEQAAREAARNRPATSAEKRAFENLLLRVEWVIKSYAKAADKMRSDINEGRAISSHTFDELITAEAERKVALWINTCLMRDCSIVATLEDVVDLCDRETSFYRPNNSSSSAHNSINDIEHVFFLKMGRIARLRTEY